MTYQHVRYASYLYIIATVRVRHDKSASRALYLFLCDLTEWAGSLLEEVIPGYRLVVRGALVVDKIKKNRGWDQ